MVPSGVDTVLPLRPVTRLDWKIIGWFAALHGVGLIAPFYLHTWGAAATAFGLYVVTGLFGITLGYHRLLSHRSFKAPRWLERVLATCGVLALQRSPFEWVAHHRMHHAYVDTPKDPHNSRRGFWWAHIGWMCVYEPRLHDPVLMRKFARDIAADRYLIWLSGEWPQVLLQLVLAAVLYAAGGWTYVVWGVFVRCLVVYHITWLVNSACHVFGSRRYDTGDKSTNCWWVGLLAFGEGWHNNHHAYPEVAAASHALWEIDLTGLAIRCLRWAGLATDVRRRPPAAAAAESEGVSCVSNETGRAAAAGAAGRRRLRQRMAGILQS